MNSDLGKISCSSDGHCTIKLLTSKRYFQIVGFYSTGSSDMTLFVYSCEQKYIFWKEENFYVLESITTDTLYSSKSAIEHYLSVYKMTGYIPSDYSLDDLIVVTPC